MFPDQPKSIREPRQCCAELPSNHNGWPPHRCPTPRSDLRAFGGIASREILVLQGATQRSHLAPSNKHQGELGCWVAVVVWRRMRSKGSEQFVARCGCCGEQRRLQHASRPGSHCIHDCCSNEEALPGTVFLEGCNTKSRGLRLVLKVCRSTMAHHACLVSGHSTRLRTALLQAIINEL